MVIPGSVPIMGDDALRQLRASNPHSDSGTCAEEAFLHHTANKTDRYLIEAQQQPTALWKFVIEAGDETHPGPEGSHWFIHIDRSTGEIEIVDGR